MERYSNRHQQAGCEFDDSWSHFQTNAKHLQVVEADPDISYMLEIKPGIAIAR